MADEAEDAVVVVLGLLLAEKPKPKRKRLWKKSWRRRECGLYALQRELEIEDSAGFMGLLRMNAEELEFILSKVAPLITKRHTKLRQAITAKERLVLTLRFLATGESFSSLSFQFRIGESTISMIVRQTCEALHRTLCDEYLKTPNTEKEWLDIAEEFLQKWQFPHCLGAIDGSTSIYSHQHIVEAPFGTTKDASLCC